MDNEYPNPDEEFDLMHEDEYEVLRELEENVNNQQSTQTIQKPLQQLKTINSIDNNFNSPSTSFQSNEICNTHISKKQSNEIVPTENANISSQRAQEKSILENDFNQPSTSYQSDSLFSNYTVNENRKRSYEELLGDISDLLGTDVFSELEPREKKPCWNQPEEIIKAVLEARQKVHEEDHQVSIKNECYKNKDKGCVSVRIPRWNFIAVTRPHDAQRLYVRVKNDENIIIDSANPMHNLLGVPFHQVMARADEILLQKVKDASTTTSISTTSATLDESFNDKLWVDKYAPQSYMDLLTDEYVNRQVLHWLKLWDKIVFNKVVVTQRKNPQQLMASSNKFENNKSNDLDSKGYPVHRIALLTGPPGLGKTTLAHMAAKHAGYNIVEINASDDRGPDAFRQILHASTEMRTVMGENPRPNCLIFDEIDGAPAASIELLLNFIQGKSSARDKKSKIKSDKEIVGCQRPVICICNELYTPALRSLRVTALVISVPPISTTRLVQRLSEIAQKEGLKVHQNELLRLATNCDCDIRTCIGSLQYMGNTNMKQNLCLGLKDTKKGLFDAWKEILKVPTNQRGILPLRERTQNIIKIAYSGESERLVQGIFHNYPENCVEKIQNVSISSQWFEFYDIISTTVTRQQIWSIMSYANYAFVAWHVYLSKMQISKLSYPTIVYETTQKITKHLGILTTIRRNCGIDNVTLVTDITPFLPDLLNLKIRTVSGHLYSSKEKVDLARVVENMLSFGLTLIQERNTDGGYEYHLDPDIYAISCFAGCKPRIKIPYAVLQIISQELQSKQVKESAQLTEIIQHNVERNLYDEQKKMSDMDVKESKTVNKTVMCKNFFAGFMKTRKETIESNTKVSPELKRTKRCREMIKKHCFIYKYKEGFSNAVRRKVLMKALL